MKKITVGILAHVDSGKTTLSEALLYVSGNIRNLGRVDKRDSYLDNYALERMRGITIFSKQAVLKYKNTSFTLIDTPGHNDFSPEAERTLSILDAAIIIISAPDGVNPHTENIFKLLDRHKIPTFIFVNKTDLINSGRLVLGADIRRKLSDACIDETSIYYEEELSMLSEDILEKHLSGEKITDDDIKNLILSRKLIPCVYGSALKLEGIDILLDLLEKFLPEKKYINDFGGKVFKISYSDKGERLTYIKITGGSLKVKDIISNNSETSHWEEKVEQIRIYSGAKYDSVNEATFGDVVAVTGLTKSSCGDMLGFEKESESSLSIPVLSYSLTSYSGKDIYTVLSDIRKIEEEEPSLKVSFNEQIKEISVLVMGEVELEVLKYRIKEKFGYDVEFGTGKIVYKETISNTVEGIGHYEPLRHYSEVHLILEPSERGSGLTFCTDCAENELAKNWQRLILTHLEEKTHKGVLTGSSITDIKITLVAGKAHKKHTDGGDFRQATYRAVRQGLMCAKSILLEPYYNFEITVPNENIGRVMTDIDRFGGVFSSPKPIDSRLSQLQGYAPASKIMSYSGEIISFTHGTGTFSYSLRGYDVCKNADEVITKIGYNPENDIANSPDSIFCEGGTSFLVKWNMVKNYMHIESVLDSSLSKSESDERSLAQRAKDYVKMVATDKELMSIFEMTYGPIKRREFNTGVVYNPSVTSAVQSQIQTPTKKKPSIQSSTKEYLLVDGYNIIFAWDELKKLADLSIDSARSSLIHRLSNYQGFCGQEIIIVFDAYKVKKNPGSIEKHQNITVVYTKEAETADTYIERVSHVLVRDGRVRVATSDGFEQMIILGNGALRIPAAAFHKELTDVENTIRAIIE